jgi:hypothetical protein
LLRVKGGVLAQIGDFNPEPVIATDRVKYDTLLHTPAPTNGAAHTAIAEQ